MEFLKERYLSFVNELDPFRDTDEDPEKLEEMLYNLLATKENWDEYELSEDLVYLYDELVAIIAQFKAAGIEII